MDNKDNLFQINSLPNKTYEIQVVVPWNDIKNAEKAVLKKEGQNIELKGFRKGMAPENLIRETIGDQKLLQMTLGEILPGLYEKAIAQFGLKPIVNPKIELVSAKEKENWQIKLTTCEEPEVNLSDYKEQIKKALPAKAKIWTPGNKQDNKEDKEKEDKNKRAGMILDWLVKNIKIEMSQLLIEDEVNRKLSQLLEEIQKLGLTLEQYLSSTGKTVETIKDEYQKSSEKSLALEFILGKIADLEKISVSDEDLNKMLAEAKSEEEKKAMESRKYYIAILLRRQKTLDFLADL